MNLTKLLKSELLTMCKELGITKCKSKNKQELINLIQSKSDQNNPDQNNPDQNNPDQNNPDQNNPNQKTKIVTEDLGKIFEMAICISYNIEYNGNYKYSFEEALKIKEKLMKLKDEFPFEIKHVAKNGNKCDFESIDGKSHLSAKTNKKQSKVCPQVIGQPTKKKFCEFFGLDVISDLEQIKNYIILNVNQMLYSYFSNTFDCPIIYYNQHKNLLLFIKLKEKINWMNYVVAFSHIIKNKLWNESSSIIVNDTVIGEFQLHKNRDCIKFRWSFEDLLNLFKENFYVANLL